MHPKVSTASDTKSTLAAALLLAERFGWRVIPLHAVRPGGSCTCEPRRDGKPCRTPGKHPRVSDWTDLATDDLEQIRAWWAKWPDANLGVATGAESGIVVFDVDSDKGGDDTFADLTARHGPLPTTTAQRTGGGGKQYVFNAPGFPVGTNAGRLGKGLDVRGEGGLIVVAPSVSSKGQYGWVAPPWLTEIADAPPWLLDLFTRALPRGEPVPDGARSYFPAATDTVKDAARAALAKHGAAIDGEGGGLHTVHAAAILTHDFALTDEEAWELFLEYNATCVPPWEEDELRERLRRGRKYGKKPYGCARTLDTLEAARKMIAEWQAKGSTNPGEVAALVRQLVWTDTTTRAAAVNDLHTATGIPKRDLNIPPAVDLEALAAREERQRDFEAGAPDLVDVSEPLAVCRRFLSSGADAEGLPAWVRWQGEFWHARGTHYEQRTDEAIRDGLYRFLDGKRNVMTGAPVKPDSAMVERYAHALQSAAALDVSTAPAWLSRREDDPNPEEVIAFPNGLLHLPARGARRWMEKTRRFFGMNALGFAYVPNVEQPTGWLRFLADVWGEDAESVETFQEFCGLAITGDTSMQKLFMLVGPPRSGKGTIGRVLRALVGEANYCAPTLNSLGGQFGAEQLIGKTLAVISDARLGPRADVSAVAERLLSISGEDAQTVERKHRTAWTAKLRARFLMMTNELPALLDQSGALASRFIILRMTRSFLGREDQGLTPRLLAELPGILHWALAGLDRLRARGYFRQPKSALQLVEMLDTMGSPVKAFVKERCEVAPGKRVPASLLYQAWVTWASAQGRDHPGTLPIFGRNLFGAFPDLKVSHPRVDGRQVKHYEGIRLADAS
jgi:putative DNA primase/helicase